MGVVVKQHLELVPGIAGQDIGISLGDQPFAQPGQEGIAMEGRLWDTVL